ncbi:uncharacterized protein LAESUDRAFT_737090 [Laetiporus sulphureus 93-53]|uniref:CxC2-like cysteine cluster KDZ transposase-associated domain-containing protein n=1 Tax=Laetiporus sulphureus 93-53 TaxID=1314785 RepID=A0A165E7I1_9APHY|nr:uncharacterized protein LAESUDRAFT_737090 [Laetiporus sulphureus 93-53]KZT06391.1 hypothetical protein LAESUDRAFT_737090 [Laetiporus sulphureus 93-53]
MHSLTPFDIDAADSEALACAERSDRDSVTGDAHRDRHRTTVSEEIEESVHSEDDWQESCPSDRFSVYSDGSEEMLPNQCDDDEAQSSVVSDDEEVIRDYHPYLSVATKGNPCDKNGEFLPQNAVPPPRAPRAIDDWSPYSSRVEFEVAELLYKREQMSAGNINTLLNLWGASLVKHGDYAPFTNTEDLYHTIDSTSLGDVKWESFSMSYQGELPNGDVPTWMTTESDVWFRNPLAVADHILGNVDFDGQMDYAPFRKFHHGERRLKDFMSGEWAWKQVDMIAENERTHGAAFVPIILGSDKTTVSVATGQNEYYPLYMGIGNTHNSVRRAHRDAVVLIGFLAIPKTDKEHADDPLFRKYRRQLFHSSLSRILRNLKPYMTTPRVVRCADGHFRRVIYGLGPYIADYPEQALLACIVQGWCPKCTTRNNDLDGTNGGRRSRKHTETLVRGLELGELWNEYGLVGDIVPFTNDFPRADIHELLSPDLLHQLIKGTFKDHLVDWVEQYLEITHGKSRGQAIMAEIDRRIAAAPPFSGLRRFPEGRGFKQWTGDDSKALMKIWLPAIADHVPRDMVRAIRAFLEFCYIARRDMHSSTTVKALEEALERFHHYRVIFQTTGVRPTGFSLPRQHSLIHYTLLVWMYGAPNGLCSSITESMHIRAVKEPWRRSSRFEALGQMLLTNQRLDKLSASRVDFESRGMLKGSCLSAEVQAISREIGQPQLPELARRFLYSQLHPDVVISQVPVPLDRCPQTRDAVYVHYSAKATFYAPSDPSGLGGMRREHIRATPQWRGLTPRFDCAFVRSSPFGGGIGGSDISVVRILLLTSFRYGGIHYPCALVRWFRRCGEALDENTGMWIVQPNHTSARKPLLSFIHVSLIIRAAHLIPVFGTARVPNNFTEHHSLDYYRFFYVNKFADHHAFELLH